ncbi:hypothetical protein B0H17DRAFT_1049814 [Mycena rosella]|uniref:F-box domain-containing protein n=1 Tax=Mycena rosella TaxID=1033263 RepID=A0AAD7DV43_MYCRO|nr:hypothetical protein B0H17DRAFT_1049814 [Mycena rosella]
MEKLPGELIDHLVPDMASIKLYRLVCKAWLHWSRCRSFGTLRLYNDDAKRFIDAMKNSLSPISSLIRRVDLVEVSMEPGPGGLYPWLYHITGLGPYPSLTYLHLHAVCEASLYFLSTFISTLSSLSTVEFVCASPTSARSILNTLACLPSSVRSMSIRRVPKKIFAGHLFPSGAQLPGKLHTLHLDNDADNFFLALLSLPQIPLFSSVILCNIWPANDSGTGKYLALVGDMLQNLSLNSTDETPLPFRDGPLAVYHNTSLQHFSITAKPPLFSSRACPIWFLLP